MKDNLQSHAWMALLLLACLAQGAAAAGAADGTSITASNGPASSPAPASAVGLPPPGRHSESNLVWGLRWDDGLQYELGNSQRLNRLMSSHPDMDVEPYHGKVGLKLQLDAADYNADSDLGDMPDDSGVRRARLYTTGFFFLRVPMSYKVEVEIADKNFYAREAYLWMSHIPVVQTLKVGHFKAPMTLEGYTASGDTLFLERAAPIEAFGPGIMFGVQPAGTSDDKRRTWAIGWFANGGQDDVSEASRSLSRFIGRMTWLPEFEDASGGTNLIHLGASGQYMRSSQSDVEFRSRPESYFAPRVVDTGMIDASDEVTWGVEFAVERGPLSLQSEFLMASASGRQDGPDLSFSGYYVAGSWLLTGENRPYNRNAGAFGRVVPRKELSFCDSSLGAWELVARFSSLDLDSHDVEGGKERMGTAGVNWYLTSQLRVMLDYAVGRVDAGGKEGDVQIIAGRVQCEF